MLAAILGVLAPVFGLIGLGFGSVKLRYLGAEDVAVLGRFVIKVALPALIFGAVAGAPLNETMNPGFLAAYAAGSVGVFAFGFWRARAAGETAPAMHGLGMSLPNSGFIGFPVVLMALGPETAARVLAQAMLVENLIILPLALVLAEVGRSAGGGPLAMLRVVAREIARNPLVVGLAAGLALALAGVPLAGPVRTVIGFLSAAGPISLVVVGGTLALIGARAAAGPVAWIVAAKLALHPALVAAGMLTLPGIDPALAAGGILTACVPMLAIFPILGRRFGVEALAATALVAAVTLSAGTLAVALVLLSRAGLVTLGG
jgi:predicted permease